MARRDPYALGIGISPFDLFRRMTQDLGRLFEPLGSGQAPSLEVSRGRKVEITEGNQQNQQNKGSQSGEQSQR